MKKSHRFGMIQYTGVHTRTHRPTFSRWQSQLFALVNDLAEKFGTFKWMPKCFNILLLSRACVMTPARGWSWDGDGAGYQTTGLIRGWWDCPAAKWGNAQELHFPLLGEYVQSNGVTAPWRTPVCMRVGLCAFDPGE